VSIRLFRLREWLRCSCGQPLTGPLCPVCDAPRHDLALEAALRHLTEGGQP
jgi:hypothetical protein